MHGRMSSTDKSCSRVDEDIMEIKNKIGTPQRSMKSNFGVALNVRAS